MPVKISIPQHAVEAKVDGAFQKALAPLTEEILNDCNQYCKEDTGALIESSHIHSKTQDGKIVWQTPYARRQYWQIRTAHKTVNPGATWRWCEHAKRRHLTQWQQQAQRLFEEGFQ